MVLGTRAGDMWQLTPMAWTFLGAQSAALDLPEDSRSIHAEHGQLRHWCPSSCSWQEGSGRINTPRVNTAVLGHIGSSSVIHYSLHKTSLASAGEITPKAILVLAESVLPRATLLHGFKTTINLKQI